MNTLFVKDLIVMAALTFFVLYVAKVKHLFGNNKGKNKAKADAKKAQDDMKKRDKTLRFMKLCMWFYHNIGMTSSEMVLIEQKYRIDRMNKELKSIKRNIKPEELAGLLKMISTLSFSAALILFFLTGSNMALIFLIGLASKPIFTMIMDAQISEEDREIEDDFPDLYLLLYSRLKKGAYTRLAPSLNDYIKSLEKLYGNKSHKAIKQFAVDFSNNLDIYGSDALAVKKLREKYRSAMVINFCNLAVQSLNGIDNSDKLLGFKIELNLKRAEIRKKNAQKLVDKGQRAIMLVYLILFQFVVLAWVAKLGASGALK